MAIEGAPVGWMQDWSAVGSGKNAHIGVLLVHGFTGAPPSMRPWGVLAFQGLHRARATIAGSWKYA